MLLQEENHQLKSTLNVFLLSCAEKLLISESVQTTDGKQLGNSFASISPTNLVIETRSTDKTLS